MLYVPSKDKVAALICCPLIACLQRTQGLPDFAQVIGGVDEQIHRAAHPIFVIPGVKTFQQITDAQIGFLEAGFAGFTFVRGDALNRAPDFAPIPALIFFPRR